MNTCFIFDISIQTEIESILLAISLFEHKIQTKHDIIVFVDIEQVEQLKDTLNFLTKLAIKITHHTHQLDIPQKLTLLNTSYKNILFIEGSFLCLKNLDINIHFSNQYFIENQRLDNKKNRLLIISNSSDVIAKIDETNQFYQLDERFAFDIEQKPLYACTNPYFITYQNVNSIMREQAIVSNIQKYTKKYDFFHKKITNNEAWNIISNKIKKNIFKLKHSLSYQQATDLIITGIPRSGTSYLCQLLDNLKNCVAINEPEPEKVVLPLKNTHLPWQVALFYQELRRDILAGVPIKNRLSGEQVTEDTTVKSDFSFYTPQVTSANFTLATKYPLAYLFRLPQLKAVMPDAQIVACIRNPLDSISSWKRTFSNLKNANADKFIVGSIEDEQLESWQKQHLTAILQAETLATKRALLWVYLAETLYYHRHMITLLNYEELVTNPQTSLKKIFKPINTFVIDKPIKISQPRQQREILDNNDIDAIVRICSTIAAKFGYDLLPEIDMF